MNSEKKIRVALIDDNDLFREGICSILLNNDRFEVVCKVQRVEDLLQSPVHVLDIVLINQVIFEDCPLEQLLKLVHKYPQAKMGLFISDIYSHDVQKAIEINVIGYLTENMEVNDLHAALLEMDQNRYWVSKNITHYLLSEYKYLIKHPQFRNQRSQRPLHLLSRRESEVLQLLADGYKNQDIANVLEVTQSTVKNHVTNILVKLKVNDRTQAVIKAIRNHWVEFHEEEPDVHKKTGITL